MDFSKIKNLIKQSGDKFIVIEDGEPEMVIMSFAEYERINNSGNKRGQEEETKKEQKEANFAFQGEEQEEMTPTAVAESIGLPVRLEDIRLEDLPI